METMQTVITDDDRKPAFITAKAHAALPRLCELLAEERGMSGVSFMDAISIAVTEALNARERDLAKQRKTK